MKLNVLKRYLSVLAVLVAFSSVGFAQANEPTENTKKEEPKHEANKEKNDDNSQNNDAVKTVGSVGGVNVDIDGDDTEQTAENDTEENDDYDNGNNQGTITNGVVTQENPILIFPNPMITSSTIRFYNPHKTAVTIDVYDNVGRLVLHVPDLHDDEYNIDKNIIPEGIYYVKIKKKNSDDDDDDDDEDNDNNEISVRNSGGSYPTVQVYTAKLVVN